MRAVTQWLALAPLFVIAGCSTFQQTPRLASSGSALSLSAADANLGEALAHYSQGLIAEASLGAGQSAFFHFKQAAALDPAHIPLNLKVVADYIGRKDYTGAVSVLNSLERAHPDVVEIRLLSGSVYQAQGNPKEAVRQFQAAIRLAPERPDGYIRLGTLRAMAGDSRKAMGVVLDGLRQVKDPQPLIEFCEAVGYLFVSGQDVPGAIPFFEQVLAYKSGHDAVREALARCYVAVGQERKALAEFGVLLKAHPEDLRLRVVMALLSMQADQYGEAVKQFDDVARRVEGNASLATQLQPLFYFWYGNTCERVGRWEDGERYLLRYLAANPESSEALNYLAYMWAERGVNLDKAGSYIKKALVQEPDNGAYLDTLGWIQYKQGDYRTAEKTLIQALKKLGDDPAIVEHLRAARKASKKR
ncbi:MAG: tetratricopeptide repeat protein [bacterium]